MKIHPIPTATRVVVDTSMNMSCNLRFLGFLVPFFLQCNFNLQLQHLHYLQYYTYNILAIYTTYSYITYICTTLQYDTNATKNDTNTTIQLLTKLG